MFRRKEEGVTDASLESAAQVSMTPMTASASVPAQESTAAAPAQVAAAPVHTSSYAPAAVTQTAPRPAAPAANSYRPAAMAAAAPSARPADAARAAAPTAQAAAVPAFSTFSDKSGQKVNRRVLTVGNDILLKGEIATCDRLVIEGRVEAKLSEVHTVEIAECGSFKGTAEVEDAEISGVFEGDLVVRNRLIIYASGEVRGNITYGEIEIERGGKLTGQIKTVAVGAMNASIQTLSGKTAAAAGMTVQEVKARVASKEFAA